MYSDKKNTQYSKLLFDDVERINHDQDYWFQLRGDNHNPLIDAATPLFGLSLRVRKLTECPNIDAIYHQTIEEIKSIDVELSEQGCDQAVLVAFRYVLCTFLDEAVMSTPWGAASPWAEQSMLSRFQNETWGGEKVFSILNRLEEDPVKYRLLLEFIYHCLLLGYEGKYRVMENGTMARDKVMQQLHDLIRSINPAKEGALLDSSSKVQKKRYRVRKQIPIWTVFFSFVLIWAAMFAGYTYVLDQKTADVLSQLNQIL